MKSIDHTVHMVHDLEAARAAWQRLGFHVRPAAKHIDLGSSNAVVHFERTYNELLWLEHAREDLRAQYVERFECGEGLAHVSLTAGNLGEERARLEALGHAPGPEGNARRAIVRPDGTADETDSSFLYNWKSPHRFLSLFFSEHRKPGAIFIPAYVDHANGAREIVRMVWLSADPAADLAYFTDSFGQEPERTGPEGFAFRGGRGDLAEVLSPEAVRARYGILAGEADPGPIGGYPIAMHLQVTDREDTRRFLTDAGVVTGDVQGAPAAPVEDTLGCVLVFE